MIMLTDMMWDPNPKTLNAPLDHVEIMFCKERLPYLQSTFHRLVSI